MIASFFKTTKPVHFVLVTVLSFLIFSFYRKDLILEEVNFLSISRNFALYFALLILIAVQSFLVTKNSLTQKSGYNVFFLLSFIAIIPETIINDKILIANLFIIFALRRIVSLQNNVNIKKKLFDAAFWIGIASLFYFWSILFFILIILAMLLFSIGHIKNWLIPFAGLTVVAICINAYSISLNNSFLSVNRELTTFSCDITSLNKESLVIGITIILAVLLWASFYYIKKLMELVRIRRVKYIVIFNTMLIALSIVILAPEKTGAELLFLFAPLAIITTNYFETIKENWFAEVFMWILVFTGLIVLMLQFYTIG